jgi:hypothetical protein
MEPTARPWYHKALLTLVMGALLVPSLALAATSYYSNSAGQQVHVPVAAKAVPKGATAKCKDGTYSFSKHRSGTCSGHKGVSKWL